MNTAHSIRNADFAILRSMTEWTKAQKESLASLPRRNAAGSAALWDAYGDFLREIGLPDSAMHRQALASYVRNARR